jgi:hypothetical protein
MTSYNRRKFIQTSTLAAIGTGIASNALGKQLTQLYNPWMKKGPSGYLDQGRVGIIGLDTSHVIVFSQALNAANPRPELPALKLWLHIRMAAKILPMVWIENPSLLSK